VVKAFILPVSGSVMSPVRNSPGRRDDLQVHVGFGHIEAFKIIHVFFPGPLRITRADNGEKVGKEIGRKL
jgi:hypothetical protein